MKQNGPEYLSKTARIQVKVCGLTRPQEASACANIGIDAIGLVFYPPSPRNLTFAAARDICRAVSNQTFCVGVFVNPIFEDVCEAIDFCRIDAVQLHGNESPDFVDKIQTTGVRVIKTLFSRKPPGFDRTEDFSPDAFLVEQGSGPLPGGNAETWLWGDAGRLRTDRPVILAGGLRPDNIASAVMAAHPDAVDVSSGVEASPGCKDIKKVAALMTAISTIRPQKKIRRVFS